MSDNMNDMLRKSGWNMELGNAIKHKNAFQIEPPSIKLESGHKILSGEIGKFKRGQTVFENLKLSRKNIVYVTPKSSGDKFLK